MTREIRLTGVALCALSLVLAGCNRATVAVYDVPKEAPETPTGPNAPSTPGMQTAAGGRIEWTKPEAWTELAPTAFRKGNYLVEDADGGQVEITVSSFPGNVGGVLANVNRWRGQAGLSPITDEQLEDSLTNLTVEGQRGQLVDILPDSGYANATRILAAIFSYGEQSWFFKMSGPQSIVANERERFLSMINGLRFFDANTPVANVQTEQTHSELAFDVPSGWTETAGSSFRIASFEIAKDGFAPADFSITRFPGDAGGESANVNRWRQQLGLGQWTDYQVGSARKTIETEELSFAFFDLRPDTDEEKAKVKERIFAAILEEDGHSWFYKLKGDAFLLETQRKKFRQVLTSSRFESASE